VGESLAQGTTLGSDTALTIERPTKPSACTADLYLDGSKAIPVVDAGTAYSVASSTDAAAGNRYEEWVYALPGANPCVVVRYFIHTTVFENYPPGAVRRFDTSALRNIFDEVRRTLIVTPYTYDQNRRGA
jgi:hypothetical protein